MSASFRHGEWLIGLAVAFLGGCAKLPDAPPAPPISDYRTFDMVPSLVRSDPQGGWSLLCRNTPVDRRNGAIRFMDAEGGAAGVLDLDALPRTFEGITFDREELWYGDLARAADGSIFLAGVGIETQRGARAHVLVQHVSMAGVPLDAPYRRYLGADAEVVYNIDGQDQDLNGLPRTRALCALAQDGSLFVAVRWETVTSAFVRVFRFPTAPGALSVSVDVPVSGPSARLLAMACSPDGTGLVVVTDEAEGNDRRTRVQGLSAMATGMGLAAGSTLPDLDLQPQQCQWAEGGYTLVGYAPLGIDGALAKPFIARFTSAAQAAVGYRLLGTIGPASRPVTAHAADVTGGDTRLMVQVHEASALPPYFDGDLTSDLVRVHLDGALAVTALTTIIPAQGLRAMDCLQRGDGTVIIGSQHPFLNDAYIHAFHLVAD
jgi:hypothetical protein